MLKKDITKEIIREVIKVGENVTKYAKIARIVNKRLWVDLTKYNVKLILQQSDQAEEVLEELNEDVQEIKPYEVIEDWEEHYYLLTHKTLNKTYKLSVAKIDQIFKDYSRHGRNLSGEDVLRKYKLKPEVFSLIKNKLRLYKASDVISPYTAEILSDEELEIKIDEAIDESLSITKDKMIVTYEKKFKLEARKAIKIVGTYEAQLALLREAIEKHEPRTVEKLTPNHIENQDRITVMISDLHIGKKDTDLIKKRIDTIVTDIINRNEYYVDIIWLWDYVETIVEGWMHPGQIEHMEGPFWFDLVMEVVTILEDMLLRIWDAGKCVTLYWISWNHDRLTMSNVWDVEKTWGMYIYELIKRWLSKTNIEVNFLRAEWNSIDLNGFNFIINHGTKWNTNMDAKRILWEHGVQNKHNIIAMGDKHHLEAMDVADNATKVIVPALAWAGEYDTRLVLSSYPWYVIIERNNDGLPNTIVRRVK